MSIFGLSLIDNFGFDFINNFLSEFKIIIHNTIDYLSNTKFYNYLNKFFFNNKTESDNSSRSIQKTMSEQYSSNESKIGENKGNSKISEWLKPENEIKEDIKENENNYKNYFIITGIIISASLIWYYSDEIKTGTTALIDWIISFRGDSSNNDGGDNINNRKDFESNIQKLKSSGSISSSNEINIQNPDSPIELVNKGKNKILTSPSIENLTTQVEEYWSETPSSPKSSGSNSSNETITQQSIISSLIDTDWKTTLPPNIKESIKYVESHLPKNDLDDSTYINQLLSDINQHNLNYSQEIVANKITYSAEQLKNFNYNVEETWKWIDKMRKEIKKFE